VSDIRGGDHYLNKGVCSLAAKLAIEYAFKNLNFNRIEIVVLENNFSSIRVAEKVGANYEGTFKNKISLNGISLPARCYSVIPQ
jgi:ribosomal-protein-alanine N-acetyltransferase